MAHLKTRNRKATIAIGSTPEKEVEVFSFQLNKKRKYISCDDYFVFGYA